MFSIVNCYYDNATNVLTECVYSCDINCKVSAFLFALTILFCCYYGCHQIYKHKIKKRRQRMFYIGNEYESDDDIIEDPELIVIGQNIEKPPNYIK